MSELWSKNYKRVWKKSLFDTSDYNDYNHSYPSLVSARWGAACCEVSGSIPRAFQILIIEFQWSILYYKKFI